MHPKDISITDYTYDLPETSIAYYPLAERDASRLLIYRKGIIGETTYRHIGDELPEGALLVFNDTKVVEARIVFFKATGGRIEIFCLEPAAEYGGMAAAMAQRGKVRWKCLIGGASKWKPGQVLVKTIGLGGSDRDGGSGGGSGGVPGGVPGDGGMMLEARYLDKAGDAFLIEFSWRPVSLAFAELLHLAGSIPLPPYIHRAPELSDSERYQTVYARHDGSVAAPTAGLHFTEAVFLSLAERNIRRTFVTLHVGAGTFLPVKAPTLEQHTMHIEFIAVTREVIMDLRQTLAEGRPVIAVGTTSARTMESLYWLGLKARRQPAIGQEELVVRQWDAYEEGGGPAEPALAALAEAALAVEVALEVEAALAALAGWMDGQGLTQLVTTTQLLITPGYEWKLVKGLITNFHQPESTLLLLVASLIGEDWRKVYAYAGERGFRFLSYGDGCLLLPA
jgi:S-adenosylmethionine:tRNA ribosyltransferase-isomerase